MLIKTINRWSWKPKYRKIYKYCKQMMKNVHCIYGCRVFYDIKNKCITLHVEGGRDYYLVIIS